METPLPELINGMGLPPKSPLSLDGLRSAGRGLWSTHTR